MPILCGATGQDLATLHVDPKDESLVRTLANMLGDPEFLLPFVAAQPQYRQTYYALTAAALLEDVWSDALANWIARTEPGSTLTKTPRGVKGALGDYLFNQRPYSHKSGDGPQDMGVHWDALVAQKSSGLWSSPISVVYVASGYGNKEGAFERHLAPSTVAPVSVRVVFPLPPQVPARGKVPALFRWEPTGAAEVLAVWADWPSFEEVWSLVAEQVANGVPANHIELLWVRAGKGVVAGDLGTVKIPARPGVYVLPETLLTDVPTNHNNRATILKATTMGELMRSAAHLGLWAPLPMWFAAYAPPRPPDLYLALRGEFDRRFSPVK
ncbi:hypothetical protein [Cellulomonas fimi]|uniref:hypothetical protein n=1 Tax=Cellulomonas fimi TaxID=1708 RepID=UPI00235A3125|nr:hypothetical protein [Cellulomonas fimi]